MGKCQQVLNQDGGYLDKHFSVPSALHVITKLAFQKFFPSKLLEHKAKIAQLNM